jgi:hypothetical protein
MDAASAGAGAASAVAPTPFIGPALAIAAMAAIFAAVMALKGGGRSASHSASGGFDIPHDLAPLTQLHPREMVLPDNEAGVIRELGRTGGASAAAPVIHIHAMDGQDVRRVLLGNQRVLAEAIRAAYRNGSRM